MKHFRFNAVLVLGFNKIFNETIQAFDDALYLILGENSNIVRLCYDETDLDETFKTFKTFKALCITVGPKTLRKTLQHVYHNSLDTWEVWHIQTEQPWFTSFDNKDLRSPEVKRIFDFSPENVRQLRDLGISRVDFLRTPVPWGSLVKHPKIEKDIDVLFFGAMNKRRSNTLSRIDGRLCVRCNDLHGNEKLNVIRRSKIVVNIHYHEDSRLETHRLELLCALGSCVVSERSTCKKLDNDFSKSVVFTSIENIPRVCKIILEHPLLSTRIGSRARYNCVERQFSFVESLRNILQNY